MSGLRYISVCSGLEAATVAWAPLGWKAVAFSEIEAFPCAVLKHHYPEVPNLGDMKKFKEWPDAAIDLLVGGTPCQSFSIAGLREGLADPRGNLALTYIAIADRYRPRRILWENVPGVLSSNGGRDFGSFLGALAQLGYGFAYRVLDAQYVRIDGFGRALPQRRRRVFVVGYLGDWRRAAAVLFDAASLHGDSPPSRKAGEEIAGPIGGSSQSGGFRTADLDNHGAYIVDDSQPYEVANCLTRRMHKGINTTVDEGQTPVTASRPVAFDMRGREGGAMPEGPHDTANIRAASGGSSRSYVAHQWAVRRLTPKECERLQGFPDGYTAIPFRGRIAADAPRYKALGNSMASNAMRWIARRMDQVEEIP